VGVVFFGKLGYSFGSLKIAVMHVLKTVTQLPKIVFQNLGSQLALVVLVGFARLPPYQFLIVQKL
jgi:hypothetical protein